MKSGDYFDYCNRILLSIENSSKSVKEISENTQIPLTTVYKTIHILQKNDLLLVKGTLHSHGKRRLFQCHGSFKSAHIRLHQIFEIELLETPVH